MNRPLVLAVKNLRGAATAGNFLRPSLGRIVVVAVLALVWLGGCGEGTGPGVQTTDSVIVSNPVPVAAAARFNASLRSATGNAVGEDLVYVALAPGTVPAGQSATVRKVGATNTVTASIIAGGLDPVPVVANPGDNIEIVVTGSGSVGPVSFTMAVPARRRPVVVRADPPPRKRDVPLNSALVFVFNEPVESGSLASGVQLFHGNTPVPGTVQLLGGTATAAVFYPSVTLDPGTDYRLVASSAVSDLSGDQLEANVTVDFTTGNTFEGTPNSIVVVPDTSEILIGSQVQVTGSARDSSGNLVHGVPFVWVSDNPSVASVSGAGLVTAVAAGVAHISGGGAITGPGVATVFVVTSRAPVASIALAPDSATIPLGPGGGTVRLSASLRDSAGTVLTFRQVQWSTSNPAIATVASGSGGKALVTGIATGSVRITAASEGHADSVSVAVVQPGAYLRVVPGGPNFYNHAHTCGLTVDGWVLCWGVNNFGQMGTATAGSAYTPVGIGGINFSQVSASLVRTCALTPEGDAYCWGQAGLGALGIGTTTAPEQCFKSCTQTPLGVVGGHRFTSLGVGGEHACALDANGTALCWGYNTGLLGIGSDAGPENCESDGASGPCSPSPVTVAGGLRFTDLAVGSEHSCALTADSTTFCWGHNPYGQLGDNTRLDRNAPVQVLNGPKFVSLSAGNAHTCALTSDGTAYCWGLNSSGQLGVGSDSALQQCSGPSPCSLTPVRVAGTTRWLSISAGGNGTCGVALDGTGYCWGNNDTGQLGDGTTVSAATPTPIAGSLLFASVTAGVWHSCGVTTSGVAYCWGSYNTYGYPTAGELGDGTTVPSLVPVKVAGQP